MLGPRYVSGKYTTEVDTEVSPTASVTVTGDGDNQAGYSCVGAAIGLQRRSFRNSGSL